MTLLNMHTSLTFPYSKRKRNILPLSDMVPRPSSDELNGPKSCIFTTDKAYCLIWLRGRDQEEGQAARMAMELVNE